MQHRFPTNFLPEGMNSNNNNLDKHPRRDAKRCSVFVNRLTSVYDQLQMPAGSESATSTEDSSVSHSSSASSSSSSSSPTSTKEDRHSSSSSTGTSSIDSLIQQLQSLEERNSARQQQNQHSRQRISHAVKWTEKDADAKIKPNDKAKILLDKNNLFASGKTSNSRPTKELTVSGVITKSSTSGDGPPSIKLRKIQKPQRHQAIWASSYNPKNKRFYSEYRNHRRYQRISSSSATIVLDDAEDQKLLLRKSARYSPWFSTFLLPLLVIAVIFLLLLALTLTLWHHSFLEFSSLNKIDKDKFVLIVDNEWTHNSSNPYDQLIREDVEKQKTISEAMIQRMLQNGSDEILANLRWISADVHVAGTETHNQLIERLQNEYRNLGLDVRRFEYDVLLSYPDVYQPNTVHHYNGSDWELLSTGMGKVLSGDSDESVHQKSNDLARVWWNAYAKPGEVTAHVVYVNYGTTEDYHRLERRLGITVHGKIALIRHGGISRGDKVRLAEHHGAIGVLLYSDPFDYVAVNDDLSSTDSNNTFPHTVWLPAHGTLYRGFGDPLTSGVPSKPGLFSHRLSGTYDYGSEIPAETEEQLRQDGTFPNIPVTPISYSDAETIFRRLDGEAMAPLDWRGALNATYRLTGTAKFRLNVSGFLEPRKITNFAAFLYGRENPDQWVLLGNHADAWTYGSVDPGTGTATMLQMAKSMMLQHNATGWRPRRTIVFCQWDAEEFGLIGSTEWVEEMTRTLEARAVAYINVDHLGGNGTVAAKAVPMLYRVLADAASRVPHPTEPSKSLGDVWRESSPRSALPADKQVPQIGSPSAGGSDFLPFLALTGVPIADLRMEEFSWTNPVEDRVERQGFSPNHNGKQEPHHSPNTYTLYHTAYEVSWITEHLLDPTKKVYAAFTAFWLEVARQLADNLVLPLNPEDYAIVLGELAQQFKMHILNRFRVLHENSLKNYWLRLKNSINLFHDVASKVQKITQAVNSGKMALSLKQLDVLNGRLRVLERCFLITHQQQNFLQNNNGSKKVNRHGNNRHIVYGISTHHLFDESDDEFIDLSTKIPPSLMSVFPGILQPILELRLTKSIHSEELTKRILDGISTLQLAVECATETLQLDFIPIIKDNDA